MKKFLFFLIIFLVILSLYAFISRQNKDDDVEIDITDTGFQYDVAICDRYFKLVECIIDNDTNENWSHDMRIEFKSEVKKIQEDWKNLSEEELAKKCTDLLENFEKDLSKERLNSFGCLTWIS